MSFDKMKLRIPTRVDARRIYLRCYIESDSDWYYVMSLKNREHLARYETQNLTRWIETPQDAEFQISEHIDVWKKRDTFVMGVFKKSTDEFVAEINLQPTDWEVPDFWIGYFVDQLYQGQGYVTEAVSVAIFFAFAYLKAHRITIQCDDTNHRSRRVAERLGLVLEGHYRQDTRNADGSLSGTLSFRLLRSEFETQKERYRALGLN